MRDLKLRAFPYTYNKDTYVKQKKGIDDIENEETREMVRPIIQHLAIVSKGVTDSKMGPENLALVFAPALFDYPDPTMLKNSSMNAGYLTKLIEEMKK